MLPKKTNNILQCKNGNPNVRLFFEEQFLCVLCSEKAKWLFKAPCFAEECFCCYCPAVAHWNMYAGWLFFSAWAGIWRRRGLPGNLLFSLSLPCKWSTVIGKYSYNPRARFLSHPYFRANVFFASMYRLYFLLTRGSLDWMKWKDLIDKRGTDLENRHFIECSQWQWILQYAMNGKNLNECKYTSVCVNTPFSHTGPLCTLSFNMTYSENKTKTTLQCQQKLFHVFRTWI